MARRVTRAERIEPTPETAAKVVADPLLRLFRLSVIELDQMRAGEEIRDVWEVLQRGVFFGVSRVNRTNWLGEFAESVPWGDAESLWRDVWVPWERRHKWAVGMVIGVVVDGRELLMPKTFGRVLDDWNRLRGR